MAKLSAETLAPTPDGGVVMGGRSFETMDGGPFGTIVQEGPYDAFIVKLGPDGSFVWNHVFNAAEDETVGSVAAGKDGAIAASVIAEKKCTVVLLSAGGKVQWSRVFDGVKDMKAAIAASGDVVAAMAFDRKLDLDPGPGVVRRAPVGFDGTEIDDVAIVWLDRAGKFLRVATFGSRVYPDGPSAIVATAEGVAVAGDFYGVVDFDPGKRVLERDAGAHAPFVAAYGRRGELRWVTAYAASGDTPKGLHPMRLGVGADGALYASVVHSMPLTDPGGTEHEGPGAVITRLDVSGKHAWTREVKGAAMVVGAIVPMAAGRVAACLDAPEPLPSPRSSMPGYKPTYGPPRIRLVTTGADGAPTPALDRALGENVRECSALVALHGGGIAAAGEGVAGKRLYAAAKTRSAWPDVRGGWVARIDLVAPAP